MSVALRLKGLFCGVMCVAAIAVAGEARAGENPYEVDVYWPSGRSPGSYPAFCDDGVNESCVQGDQVTFTASYVKTNPAQVSLSIDWANTVLNEDDVPWCVVQIQCHDGVGGHTITDVEDWGTCAAANAYDQNPPGTNCDIADEIMIMVGVNRGGFS
jgi:hypothetical protein